MTTERRKTNRLALVVVGVLLALLLLGGVLVAWGLNDDDNPGRLGVTFDGTVDTTPPDPAKKGGAERLVLNQGLDQLSPDVRQKFLDPASGYWLNNTYVQCYPGYPWKWVCELDTWDHPRPTAWYDVRGDTGQVRLRGEQPLGYGWRPAPTALGAKTRCDVTNPNCPDSTLPPGQIPPSGPNAPGGFHPVPVRKVALTG